VHAGTLPHWHTPDEEQLSAVEGSHATHISPPTPQFGSPGVMHVVPEQHPLGHEVALQAHTPSKQICPETQAGRLPHVHAPSVQPSPMMPQLAQVPPVGPHSVGDCVVQTLPAQQPVRHDVALQMHAPAEHCCPVAHGVVFPHWQTPDAEQLSAVIPQLVHAPPAVPQADTEGGVQVGPEQQPVGHVVLLQLRQVPALQAALTGQLWHAPPPDPQALSLLPVSHVEPAQQPPHDVPSQVHCPLTQC
jgi:hypothetical protein